MNGARLTKYQLEPALPDPADRGGREEQREQPREGDGLGPQHPGHPVHRAHRLGIAQRGCTPVSRLRGVPEPLTHVAFEGELAPGQRVQGEAGAHLTQALGAARDDHHVEQGQGQDRAQPAEQAAGLQYDAERADDEPHPAVPGRRAHQRDRHQDTAESAGQQQAWQDGRVRALVQGAVHGEARGEGLGDEKKVQHDPRHRRDEQQRRPCERDDDARPKCLEPQACGHAASSRPTEFSGRFNVVW